MTTGNPSAAQIERAMAKNRQELEKHLVEKCGKGFGEEAVGA